jgi:hypothetical protein
MLGKIKAPFSSIEANLSISSEALILLISSAAISAILHNSFGAESKQAKSM